MKSTIETAILNIDSGHMAKPAEYKQFETFGDWVWFQFTHFSIANFVSVVTLIVISSQLSQKISDVGAQVLLTASQLQDMKIAQQQSQAMVDDISNQTYLSRYYSELVENLTTTNLLLKEQIENLTQVNTKISDQLSYLNATWVQSVGNIIPSITSMGDLYQLCDGSWISRNANPILFSLLNSTTPYNATHFKIFDLRGASLMGDTKMSLSTLNVTITNENLPSHFHGINTWPWQWDIGDPGVQTLNFVYGGGCLQGTDCNHGTVYPLKAAAQDTNGQVTEFTGNGIPLTVNNVLNVQYYIRLG